MQVLSYNILTGGAPRLDQLTSMIRDSHADVIGLAEATNAHVVEELASRLQMHFFLTGRGRNSRDWNVALLSRFPIISTQIHTNTAVFSRHHMLEATLEEPGGQQVTVFVAHFIASFHRGPQSNRLRRAEVQEIMRIMEPQKGKPHLLMGDFNAIAPGDTLNASDILRYNVHMRDQKDAYLKKQALTAHKPYIPPPFSERLIFWIIRTLLHSRGGQALIHASTPLYTQGGFDLLLAAGYTDCFRSLHPGMLAIPFQPPIPLAASTISLPVQSWQFACKPARLSPRAREWEVRPQATTSPSMQTSVTFSAKRRPVCQ